MPAPSENKPQPPARRRKWLRRGGVSLLAVAVLLGIAVALLPTIAGWQIKSRLAALGAQSVKVEGLYINPATGHISVDRFASVGPDGEDISVGATSLTISLPALARRRIAIRELSVADADIDLRLDNGGIWSVGGFSIEIASDEAKQKPDTPWQLEATDIAVDNSRMTLAIGETLQIAMVEKLRVDNLSSLRPDTPATIDLTAQAADGTIRIQGQAFPFAELPNLALKMNVASIDLNALKSLIAAGRIKDIAGIAALSGDLTAGMSKSGGAAVTYTGSATLSEASTDTALFRTRSTDLSWNGAARIAFASPDSETDAPPDIRLDGVAAAAAFRFRNKTTGMTLAAETAIFDFSKTGMTLQTKPAGNSATKVTGHLNARLTGALLEQRDSGLKVAPRRLTIDGNVDLTLPAKTAAFSALLSGTVDTDALEGTLASAGIDALSASGLRLTYDDARVEISATGGISVKANAGLGVTGLKLDAPRFGVSARAGKISGVGQKIAFDRADNGAIGLSLSGPFTAEDVTANGADTRWRAGQKNLSWNGRIAVSGTGGKNGSSGKLSVAGDAAMSGMTATLNPGDGPNAYGIELQRAELKELSIEDGRMGMTTAAFAGMSASGEAEASSLPQVRLKSLRLSGLVSDDRDGIAVDTLRASGLNGRLTKSEAGTVRFPEIGAEKTPAEKTPSAGATPAPGVSAAAPAIRIGEATLTDSSLEFIDEAVTPAFSIATSRLQASLKNFDSAKPDSDADIRLLVGLGKYGRLDMSGTLKPRFETITADIGIGFKDMELFKFNSFIAPAIKHSVRQGRADGDIDLALRDDVIKASTSLVVSRLEVRPLPAAASASTGKTPAGAGPPMETAINLLQNDKGVMKLSIPISGSLNDPQFDLSNAIGQAIAGAMQKTILTAVRIAFPLGTVVAILDSVGNPKIRIKPIEFPAGTTELTPALKNRVAEIAAYLKKKTDDTPSVCGPATAADLAALRKTNPKADTAAAVKTAEARIRSVRDALVATHGIPARRIFVCAPEYSDAPGLAPQITVGQKD
tara:strand:- start:1314 stop:4421 length:3108 start_codon:yes stop_codon:yes gene_type:complete